MIVRRIGRLTSAELIDALIAGTYFGSLAINADQIPDGDIEPSIYRLLSQVPTRAILGNADLATAMWWLNAGAVHVILPVENAHKLLGDIPPDRAIVEIPLDLEQCDDAETAQSIASVAVLVDSASGIQISCPAQLTGDINAVQSIADRIGQTHHLTLAIDQIDSPSAAKLDSLGIDVQLAEDGVPDSKWVADYLSGVLVTDRADGLWPTIVTDEFGVALGLVYSSEESLHRSIELGRGVYWSRSRDQLWYKGETSGAVQRLVRIDVDCDRDALRFKVLQADPGFCHLNRRDCFGDGSGDAGQVFRQLQRRVAEQTPGSYTNRLLDDPHLLSAKLREEVEELIEAGGVDDATWEAADLVYFVMVAALKRGTDFGRISNELSRRMSQVTRRSGDAKSEFLDRE